MTLRHPARTRRATTGKLIATPFALAALLGATSMGQAQVIRQGTSPRDLPRPGYERRPILIGATQLRLELDASALYDTNVYATSRDETKDVAIYTRPKAELDWRGSNVELHGEAYGEARRYFDTKLENATSFGTAASMQLTPGGAHSLSSEIRFDRTIENRADPEARASRLLPPRKINVLSGEANYGLRGSHFGINLTGAVQKSDYLDPNEQDRDFTMFRGAARFTWRPTAPVSFFAETYINRRNFRLPLDVSGFNRDASTYGVLGGVSREVTGRLTGRVGAGVFRFDPDDNQLKPYSGFAMSGDVTWMPRARTMATLKLFRGDVATARVGATGRTDTTVTVGLEQEVRHNLLVTGRAGWIKRQYRGVGSDRFSTVNVGGEVEYLVNRAFSVYAGADYFHRASNDPLEEFSRGRFQAGVRARF